ncbi:MAG: hypothetical protein DCF20_16820 [Pseudanabaena sp.]|nr:MAG: hypothetical protein DCF20_16820 [Pseudanabaena sp.]
MAILIFTNFVFVIFDLSYIEGRKFYLWTDIKLQQLQPDSQKQYLEIVDELQKVLQQESLDSPKVELLLATLRQLSIQLFAEAPPFRNDRATGNLAEIQRQFRQQLRTTDLKKALEIFWSRDYFAERGWQSQLTFFNTKVRFLVTLYEPILGYDIIKGIEPYVETENYLKKVAELRTYLEFQGMQSKSIAILLAELRGLSNKLVDSNYFGQSNEVGNLAEIKHRMKRHVFKRDPDKYRELSPSLKLLDSLGVLEFLAPELLWADLSTKDAFQEFWSERNFRDLGWQTELNFFDDRIAFLLRSNYYRHISANNKPIDRFWLLDLPWNFLFGLELLIRIVIMHRRDRYSFFKAVEKRWYDLFLLLPVLAPLRIITAIIRLEDARLINLDKLNLRLRLGFVSSFAKELVQVVIGQGIDFLQSYLGGGGLKRAIIKQDDIPKPDYVDLNDTNEIKAIGNQLIEIIACKVLPEIHDDLEAWLQYQVEQAMHKSSLYKKLERIPLLRRLPNKIKDNLVNQIVTAITESPKKSYEASHNGVPDVVGEELQKRLVKSFSSKLQTELKQEHTLEEIESLLSYLLEEIKVNFLNRPADDNLKKLNSTK